MLISISSITHHFFYRQIVCASSQDAGKYKCLATNSEGNICSKEASVEVVSFQSDNNFTSLSWQRNIHLQYSDSNHVIPSQPFFLPPTEYLLIESWFHSM